MSLGHSSGLLASGLCIKSSIFAVFDSSMSGISLTLTKRGKIYGEKQAVQKRSFYKGSYKWPWHSIIIRLGTWWVPARCLSGGVRISLRTRRAFMESV